ncbi:dienelactone hydrolase family protein [Ophiobolus disseminans]|uniref:Dienelactone hydrolase family protein n=1 Tax=Ophiobolus disseminans TaxID=1469910 RepID=A0A6A7A1M4_9PLEO|nr:dienelactone hydrolase family protein [Ophiobolus disseminans]
MPTPIPPCCLKSFPWTGTPTGTETSLSSLPTYTTGTNRRSALLFIPDLLGWRFPNARLLADAFAAEANLTVFMPDFFAGEELDRDAILEGRWGDLDLLDFSERNARGVREGAVVAAARELRARFERVGAVGYCYGGWAVLRLGAREEGGLLDCGVVGHPSWVVEGDFDGFGNVPLQILAPEVDGQFTDELKGYAFRKLVLEKKGDDGVPVDWVHYPGVAHGCLTKGDENVKGEREAMVKGKDAAVGWLKQWLS